MITQTTTPKFFISFFKQIQKYRWLKHILFWGILELIFILRSISSEMYPRFRFDLGLWSIIQFFPAILATYTIAYFAIPMISKKKKKIIGCTTLLIILWGASAVTRILNNLSYHGYESLQTSILDILLDWKCFMNPPYLIPISGPIIIFLTIKQLTIVFEKQIKKLELDKITVENELSILKKQLNPHFLFNTLNNIYCLTVDQSPKAPKAIEKLSQILDYALYHTKTHYVNLLDEIKMVENYIALEHLRYGDRLSIEFEKNLENETIIIPLTLLHLTENIFEYGISNEIGQHYIKIFIESKDKKIFFEISNNYTSQNIENKTNNDKLQDIKKQLLLWYPKKHLLTISEIMNHRYLYLEIQTE